MQSEFWHQRREECRIGFHQPDVEALCGDDYRLDTLDREELLAQSPHFRERGFDAPQEKASRLTPRRP